MRSCIKASDTLLSILPKNETVLETRRICYGITFTEILTVY